MTKSNADILAEFTEKVCAAIANVEKQHDLSRQAYERGERASDNDEANRMFAEGILRHYRDLGIREDGTLVRHEGEDDDDMVKHLRRNRRNLTKKMLFTPEQPREGIAGLRQHFDREGSKRFLSETTFVRAEGEL
ncbi:hypothetical protein OG497_37885 [Streptomyces sp. NBC_01242]|uniref:hypothetical protein n=1 Tax=Streptomyces sp. NBC_01242 TaxID=2903795 RepID=UPI002250AE53|nr:hypothetical protein [Streptomyces sp. NBC_01242]MCX4799630.1 hypothetical protein [Streptomyces sp. NBC_01242]